MESLGIGSRRQNNQSALDKKKRKKRKKKTREGKRSSASSASASGSPDSTGQCHPKTQGSRSCPSILGSNEDSNLDTSKNSQNCSTIEIKVNECLRWPAHSLYIENSFRTDLIGKFPMPGATEEEENERIAIYKMNRRKRYLAAQQALIKKHPDGNMYVTSSGSSSGHDTLEDGIRLNSGRNAVPSGDSKIPFHSASVNGSLDSAGREIQEKTQHFSNVDITRSISKTNDLNGFVTDSRKKICAEV